MYRLRKKIIFREVAIIENGHDVAILNWPTKDMNYKRNRMISDERINIERYYNTFGKDVIFDTINQVNNKTSKMVYINKKNEIKYEKQLPHMVIAKDTRFIRRKSRSAEKNVREALEHKYPVVVCNDVEIAMINRYVSGEKVPCDISFKDMCDIEHMLFDDEQKKTEGLGDRRFDPTLDDIEQISLGFRNEVPDYNAHAIDVAAKQHRKQDIFLIPPGEGKEYKKDLDFLNSIHQCVEFRKRMYPEVTPRYDEVCNLCYRTPNIRKTDFDVPVHSMEGNQLATSVAYLGPNKVSNHLKRLRNELSCKRIKFNCEIGVYPEIIIEYLKKAKIESDMKKTLLSKDNSEEIRKRIRSKADSIIDEWKGELTRFFPTSFDKTDNESLSALRAEWNDLAEFKPQIAFNNAASIIAPVMIGKDLMIRKKQQKLRSNSKKFSALVAEVYRETPKMNLYAFEYTKFIFTGRYMNKKMGYGLGYPYSNYIPIMPEKISGIRTGGSVRSEYPFECMYCMHKKQCPIE